MPAYSWREIAETIRMVVRERMKTFENLVCHKKRNSGDPGGKKTPSIFFDSIVASIAYKTLA